LGFPIWRFKEMRGIGQLEDLTISPLLLGLEAIIPIQKLPQARLLNFVRQVIVMLNLATEGCIGTLVLCEDGFTVAHLISV